jgi:hypothetical protein
MRRRSLVFIAASWSWVAMSTTAFAVPPLMKVVDDETLYRLLVDELSATLEERGRLVPLPRNVRDVVIGLGGEPCFFVPAVDEERPASLAPMLRRIERHAPGFRILWEGSVIGGDGDRAMILATADPMSAGRPTGPAEVAIVERNTTKTIPMVPAVEQAVRVRDRYVFLTALGLFGEGEKNAWPGSNIFARMRDVRMLPLGTNGLAVFASSRGPDGHVQLRLGVFDGDGQGNDRQQDPTWSIHTIASLGQKPVSAVVRLRDGQWLVITDRIVEIDADWHARESKGLYRGQSVRVMQVLRQEKSDSALLVIETGDEATRARRYAVARLEPDGALTRSCELPDRWWGPRGSTGWVRDASDGVCGILTGKGLVRLSERGLETIGEGGRLAGNMKVVAADAHGRVYLRESRHRPGTKEDADAEILWVHSGRHADAPRNAKTPADETPAVAIWPLFTKPTVGTGGDVWFQTFSPEAVAELQKRGATLPLETSGVVTKTVTVAEIPKPEPAAISGKSPDHGQASSVRLLRLDNPTTVIEYTNLALPGTARLVAGRSALWMEGFTASLAKDRLGFFDGSTIVRGDDIHALAGAHFEAMLAAAPTTMLPGVGTCLPRPDTIPPPFQVLRTGNLLWVCSSARVEVYDKGHALSLFERLSLHATRRLENPQLIGPIDRGDGGKSLVLLAAPGEIERFVWITPTDVGITIEQAKRPPQEFSPGISLHVPGRFAGLPLVTADASRLAASGGTGRVWQILGPKTYVPLPDAGDPILAIPNTDAFLARCADPAYSGIRICSPQVRRDVAVTFTKRLDPVAFAPDGRLLCFAPDGVAWLSPNPDEGYVLSARRLLPHDLAPQGFVAFVGTSAVITATTPVGETCLVAIRDAMRAP